MGDAPTPEPGHPAPAPAARRSRLWSATPNGKPWLPVARPRRESEFPGGGDPLTDYLHQKGER